MSSVYPPRAQHRLALADHRLSGGIAMDLKVVGAGVGRTGTHSLKLALEQLLGGPCHHMLEILGDPAQVPSWIDAIDGKPTDWSVLDRYVALVDWPGASFW